jgi:hypothetical protein
MQPGRWNGSARHRRVQEREVKQLTINMDTVILLGIILLLSLGMNAWQHAQFNDLMTEYVGVREQAQNDKVDLVHVRTLLKRCDPKKYADLKVDR